MDSKAIQWKTKYDVKEWRSGVEETARMSDPVGVGHVSKTRKAWWQKFDYLISARSSCSANRAAVGHDRDEGLIRLKWDAGVRVVWP